MGFVCTGHRLFCTVHDIAPSVPWMEICPGVVKESCYQLLCALPGPGVVGPRLPL